MGQLRRGTEGFGSKRGTVLSNEGLLNLISGPHFISNIETVGRYGITEKEIGAMEICSNSGHLGGMGQLRRAPELMIPKEGQSFQMRGC